MMSTQWIIRIGKQVSKPLSWEQVQDLFRQKRIPANALLSRDGNSWRTVKELQERHNVKRPSQVAGIQATQLSNTNEDQIVATVRTGASMNVRVTCQCCEKVFHADEKLAGRIANCPNCGGQTQIPVKPPHSPGFKEPSSGTRFHCPKCGKAIRVKAEHIGKRGKCPGCGEIFRIADDLAATHGEPLNNHKDSGIRSFRLKHPMTFRVDDSEEHLPIKTLPKCDRNEIIDFLRQQELPASFDQVALCETYLKAGAALTVVALVFSVFAFFVVTPVVALLLFWFADALGVAKGIYLYGCVVCGFSSGVWLGWMVYRTGTHQSVRDYKSPSHPKGIESELQKLSECAFVVPTSHAVYLFPLVVKKYWRLFESDSIDCKEGIRIELSTHPVEFWVDSKLEIEIEPDLPKLVLSVESHRMNEPFEELNCFKSVYRYSV